MRHVDHKAHPIHLGDHLSAKRRKTVPFPSVTLARMGIGELIVRVVRQRHVTRTTLVKFLDPANVLAHRIAVLDADERNFFSFSVNPANIG